MDMVKKYKASIFGELYTLVSDETEDVLLDCARQVDALMRELAEKSGLADSKKIAVLAAMQFACELKNCQRALENARYTELRLVERIDQELGVAYLPVDA